jgi:ferrochelatase
MARDDIRYAVGMIMSVFKSRSSWDQYQREIATALTSTNIDLRFAYTPPFFDQSGFINTMARHIADCRKKMTDRERKAAYIVFTAHSLPRSDPQSDLYEQQITYSAARIASRLACSQWQIAFQSRSGRPQDPWLEPDVNDVLRRLARDGVTDVTIAPIGFVCDNIEVLYDLDVEARQTAQTHGIRLTRATSVGSDPEFIQTMAEMVKEISGF